MAETRTTIYLVRHGETTWNKEGRFQGHMDVELSPVGLKQAEIVAERMKQIKIDQIYTSDLKRAYKTAEIIAKPHSLQLKEINKIREIHIGIWGGKTLEEIRETHFDEFRKWNTDENYTIDGGESFKTFNDRVYESLLSIMDKHKGENICVVTHGGVVKSFVSSILELSKDARKKFFVQNCSITTIAKEGKRIILETLNDYSHTKNL